jgi:hypothetical protein
MVDVQKIAVNCFAENVFRGERIHSGQGHRSRKGLFLLSRCLCREVGKALPRPQPAEGTSRQQGVDQAVERLFKDHAPRLTLPDAVHQGPKAVTHERHAPRNHRSRASRLPLPTKVRD